MATFEARIEAMTQIAIESSGTAPKQSEVSEFLTEGIIDLTNKIINLRPDEAFKFADETTASNDSGISVTGKILSVVREHDSTSILRPCTPMSADLRYEATDVNSLHYRSKYNPGFYILNKKVYVRPAASSSDNDMKVSMIDYKSTTYNASVITDFPDEYEYMVVIYAAGQSCLAAASAIQNNMPTKPVAPEQPNFESIDFEVSLPSFPVYNPPHLGEFNYSEIRNAIIKEDKDTADGLKDIIDTKFDEYEKYEKQYKQEYDTAQKNFEQELQTLEKNKEREFQIVAGDYRSQIYKYQYELTQYQAELQEVNVKYKWFIDQYVSFMNEYTKGITGALAAKKEPAGAQVRQQKIQEPAKEGE
tara:strand:+ start:1614 stop:2696 length:1083 start_codon:yes stop_codon:yes gene_type:complete